MRPFALIWGLS